MEIQWCFMKWRWEKRGDDNVWKSNGLFRPYLFFHISRISSISEEDLLLIFKIHWAVGLLEHESQKCPITGFVDMGLLACILKSGAVLVFLIEFLHESENNQWFVAHCLQAPETAGFSHTNFPSWTQLGFDNFLWKFNNKKCCPTWVVIWGRKISLQGCWLKPRSSLGSRNCWEQTVFVRGAWPGPCPPRPGLRRLHEAKRDLRSPNET